LRREEPENEKQTLLNSNNRIPPPGFPFASIIVGLAIGVLLLRVKPPVVKGKFGL
jgi:hypothetical protein